MKPQMPRAGEKLCCLGHGMAESRQAFCQGDLLLRQKLGANARAKAGALHPMALNVKAAWKVDRGLGRRNKAGPQGLRGITMRVASGGCRGTQAYKPQEKQPPPRVPFFAK